MFEACNHYHRLSLHAGTLPPLLHDLKLKQLVLYDLDEEARTVYCKDKDVFTFWNDQEWVDELLEAGAKRNSASFSAKIRAPFRGASLLCIGLEHAE